MESPIRGPTKNDRKDLSHFDRAQIVEKRLARHLYGEYSMASVQGKARSEDRCQLVSGSLSYVPNGPTGVFVGIYDGHGGELCSQFIKDNLYNHLKAAITNRHGHVDETVIQEAYKFTENKFHQHVRRNWQQIPNLASAYSCCLLGLVHGNKIYVANAGDSRAVVARWTDREEHPQVQQLSIEHNAKDQATRDDLREQHLDDPDLFRVVNGAYRVRGVIQVTRAIGDVYLKSNDFNCEPLGAQYHQQQPITRPVLKAEPTIQTYDLEPSDRFVIFGSDGLWEQVNNEEAVSIVKSYPRPGAARALLKEALDKARHKTNLQRDDKISIAIIFLDHIPPQNQVRGWHAKESKKFLSHSLTSNLRTLKGKTEKECLLLLEDHWCEEAGEDHDEEYYMAEALEEFSNFSSVWT